MNGLPHPLSSSRSGRALVGTALFASFLCSTRPTAAFCPARTCNDAERICSQTADGCVSEGEQIRQPNGCIAFAVGNGQASRIGFTEERYLRAIERAFSRWADADCGNGRTPGLAIVSHGFVSAADSFYCPLPNSNLSVWTMPEPWPLSPASLGFTQHKFDVQTSVIVDSDVILNAERLLWHVDEFGLSPSELESLLLTVATHEAGHVLGLGHSQDSASIMGVRYRAEAIDKRDLSADDAAGICALYPPDSIPDTCDWPTPRHLALNAIDCEELSARADEAVLPSCSLFAEGQRGPPPLWAVLLLCTFLWRSRHSLQ